MKHRELEEKDEGGMKQKAVRTPKEVREGLELYLVEQGLDKTHKEFKNAVKLLATLVGISAEKIVKDDAKKDIKKVQTNIVRMLRQGILRVASNNKGEYWLELTEKYYKGLEVN
jgi:hypothetical protein